MLWENFEVNGVKRKCRVAVLIIVMLLFGLLYFMLASYAISLSMSLNGSKYPRMANCDQMIDFHGPDNLEALTIGEFAESAVEVSKNEMRINMNGVTYYTGTATCYCERLYDKYGREGIWNFDQTLVYNTTDGGVHEDSYPSCAEVYSVYLGTWSPISIYVMAWS